MRLSFSIGCALFCALLAGCSTPTSGPAIPLSSSNTRSTANGAESMGSTTALKLLKLQAAGKIAGPVPQASLRRMLSDMQAHQAGLRFSPLHKAKSIGLWVTMTDYDVVLAQTSSGKKTLGAIVTDAQGGASGYFPITVKVDGSQNVWVADELNANANGEGSVLQEYDQGGTLTAAYTWNLCQQLGYINTPCSAEGFDGSVTPSYVFAEVSSYTAMSFTQIYQGSGFEYWPTGDPSATPTFISLTYGAPVEVIYYMDVDASGNIWFDYYGYDSTTLEYGYGLGEIKSPTTNPEFVSVLPVGSIGFAGGVYISGKTSAQVLNVTDQLSLKIYQYHLPLSPGGSPFNTLGPTYYFGDPVSGGFNEAETKNAQGDCVLDSVDRGIVSTNRWKPRKNIADVSCLSGAAYTPSDR
jgi:hypothetical protein